MTYYATFFVFLSAELNCEVAEKLLFVSAHNDVQEMREEFLQNFANSHSPEDHLSWVKIIKLTYNPDMQGFEFPKDESGIADFYYPIAPREEETEEENFDD